MKENSSISKRMKSNQQRSQLYTQSEKDEVKGSVKMFMTEEGSSIVLSHQTKEALDRTNQSNMMVLENQPVTPNKRKQDRQNESGTTINSVKNMPDDQVLMEIVVGLGYPENTQGIKVKMEIENPKIHSQQKKSTIPRRPPSKARGSGIRTSKAMALNTSSTNA